ncbi:MAG: STAS domain-containing protein [Acidobacteriia bacterium]|nr:STAS domain-containing protein [Terriglobia bacterium]
MPLEIQQREKEGIVLLDLKGRLVLGPEDVLMRQHLQSLLDGGSKNVILDVRAAPDIDTAGFGSLVLFAEKFREAGGRLAIIEQSMASSLLRLAAALDTYTDEQAAINSFFPDRAVPHYDILEFVEEEEQRQHSDSDRTDK